MSDAWDPTTMTDADIESVMKTILEALLLSLCVM